MLDAVKWPFQRLAWAVQEHLLWPLQDRADGWSRSTRAVAAGGVALVALGGCALGLVLATGGNSQPAAAPVVAPVTPPPAPVPTPIAKAPAAPVLHGVPPVFKAKAGLTGAKATGAKTKSATGSSTSARQDRRLERRDVGDWSG